MQNNHKMLRLTQDDQKTSAEYDSYIHKKNCSPSPVTRSAPGRRGRVDRRGSEGRWERRRERSSADSRSTPPTPLRLRPSAEHVGALGRGQGSRAAYLAGRVGRPGRVGRRGRGAGGSAVGSAPPTTTNKLFHLCYKFT